MIIHYRTYLQFGITNTFPMPNISIASVTKYKHHSTAILGYIIRNEFAATAWLLN